METKIEIFDECKRVIDFFKPKKWYFFNDIPNIIFDEIYDEIIKSNRFIIDNDFETRFMKLF